MKKVILTTLFLSISLIVFSQSFKEGIKSDFLKLNKSIITKEQGMFNSPLSVASISLDKMTTIMDSVFVDSSSVRSPSMDFKFKEAKIININPLKKKEDKFHALVIYTNKTEVKIYSNKEKESLNEFRKNKLKFFLEKFFGSENVVYSKEYDSFEITEYKKFDAVSKDGKTKWN